MVRRVVGVGNGIGVGGADHAAVGDPLAQRVVDERRRAALVGEARQPADAVIAARRGIVAIARVLGRVGGEGFRQNAVEIVIGHIRLDAARVDLLGRVAVGVEPEHGRSRVGAIVVRGVATANVATANLVKPARDEMSGDPWRCRFALPYRHPTGSNKILCP
jgi:hypothetical protein